MNTVSIAMCTYNGSAFLLEQLNSLSAQTLKPNEIIISDDASVDDSIAICKAFAEKSNINIKILENKSNIGYIKNFEKAISHCTQDIIFLCDQDDIWRSDKIDQILKVFNSEPEVGLILHNFSKIDDCNRPMISKNETYGLKNLTSCQLPDEIINNSINVFLEPYPRAWCGCMMAYRKSFNDLVLPVFPGKGHDDWILKILAPVTELRFITEKLIDYRIHENNTNRRDNKKHNIFYLLNRAVLKFSLAIKGHTKRNFYGQIISRVKNSQRQTIHPNLIDIYKKYG